MKNYIAVVLCLALMVGACKKHIEKPAAEINFEFTTDTQGWSSIFCDYPVGEESFYELGFGFAKMPAPLNTMQGSVRISGNNHSDNLFMGMKRKITGLKPLTSYKINFVIELASNAASNATGIGGAPGEGVGIGAGATAIEPLPVNTSGFYGINISKIDQCCTSGNNMKVLGNIANGTSQTTYKIISRIGNITATTDPTGSIWLIVGTDSGFEGITTLYYSRISASFVQQ